MFLFPDAGRIRHAEIQTLTQIKPLAGKSGPLGVVGQKRRGQIKNQQGRAC